MQQETTDPIIEIKELSKTFGTKQQTTEVLCKVSLTVQTGDIYGMIGMSGAGKSTLIRCINYLERPTSGAIIFEGKDLSRLSSAQLRKVRLSMGMVFQQFNLLQQRDVLHNICFPLEIAGVGRAQAKKRAVELLELVGMSGKAGAYPAQLSGGQKQRVAIARAVAANPKVLLCDEATSALDPETTDSILSLLKEINKKLGITIIMITHEMDVIEKICTHVAILDHGKLAEAGRVKDIFQHPKTKIGERFVFHDQEHAGHSFGERCLRIVFDGRASSEPVIANMVLSCKVPVNILYADTRNIDGNAVGHMVIQLPGAQEAADRVAAYLKSSGLEIEEISGYVGS